MNETHSIFEERKSEIEFYFSVLEAIDSEKDVINTADNRLFFRIMKSNFLLMLYNIVEATIITGMSEIYERVRDENCAYASLSEELQSIWRNYKVKEVYGPSTELKTYTERVSKIVKTIMEEEPLIFNRKMLNINGNLNAKIIKDLCDKHRIRYKVKDDEFRLESVRKKRNSLSHGDESFSECARDLTISQLRELKETIFEFLTGIIAGMEKYYNEKQYLRAR